MPKNGEPVHRPSEGVLRASEAELVVGAVGKHSSRTEYPKIPENISGIQVTFTSSVNNGWWSNSKSNYLRCRIQRVPNQLFTEPYMALNLVNKVFLLWNISAYQEIHQTKRFVRNHINDNYAVHYC